MRAIDSIIDHFRATRHARNKAVGFAHGDGAGIEIHWGPWTLGEQDRVFGAFDIKVDPATGNTKMPPAVFARILLVKAEDANGEALFKDFEEQELLAEADPREVTRLATLIMADLNATAAAAKGKGEGDAPNV